MSIEARQIQKTLHSYAAILNFTFSPQGLRAKFGACSVQNAQLFTMLIFDVSHMTENIWKWKRHSLTKNSIGSNKRMF